MSKAFSVNDLYNLMSANSGVSPKTAKKVWNTTLDVIISELQYNDKIAIDNFGRFEIEYKGGKDEWFTNELGIPEKRYVEPIMSIKFSPSVNFLKRLNEDIVEQMGMVEPNDPFFEYGKVIVDKEVEKSLNDRIDLVLERKAKRREGQKTREKKYQDQRDGLISNDNKKNIFKGNPVKCVTINKSYPSMSKCAKDLNLRVANVKKALDTGELVYGYKFIPLTDSEYEEELNKLGDMKKRNELYLEQIGE